MEKRVVKVEFIGDWDALTQDPEHLRDVKVVVRCALCGDITMRSSLFMFEDLRGRLACKRHGRLADPTMGEIREEWNRRSKPRVLNIKRNPLESSP
jgi:hypothetical protein